MLPSLKQNLKPYRQLDQRKTLLLYTTRLKKYVVEEIAAHPENAGTYLDVDIEKDGYVQYSIPTRSFKDVPKIEKTLMQVKRYDTLRYLLMSLEKSENAVIFQPDFDLSLINFNNYWALTNAVQCITNLPRNPDYWRILPENIVALSVHQCFKYGDAHNIPLVPEKEWVENLWVVSRYAARNRLVSAHRLWGTQPLIADARKALVRGYRQRDTKGGDTTPYLRLLTEISLQGNERHAKGEFFSQIEHREQLRQFIDACLSRDISYMFRESAAVREFVIPRDTVDESLITRSCHVFTPLVHNKHYWEQV